MALFYGDEAAEKTALAILKRLGATPAAELMRNKMRAEDIRGNPRGPRAAAKRNPAGLTPRALEVLILVAEGSRTWESQRDCSSRRRRSITKVSAILAKLNVRPRAEAVAAAYNLEILPQQRESSKQT